MSLLALLVALLAQYAWPAKGRLPLQAFYGRLCVSAAKRLNAGDRNSGILAWFVLLAAGKPAEYVRFGLVVAAAASIFGLITLHLCPDTRVYRTALMAIVFIALIVQPLDFFAVRFANLIGLIRRGDAPTQYGKASWTLALSHEPAPWSVMPLNLFRDTLILTRPSADPKTAPYDVYLYPSNLSSQIGLDASGESVDWADNRTQMILGSLRSVQATTPATK